MPSPTDIIQFFIQFFDSGWFLVAQIIGGAISIILLIVIIWLTKLGGYPQRHLRHLRLAWNGGKVRKARLVSKWSSIEGVIEIHDPKLWRRALIDADSMLDEVLAKIGYEGGNLDERLENVSAEQFPSLAEAWRAHQVRRFVEEDPSYLPTREVMEKTVEIYRNIFKETGIIL